MTESSSFHSSDTANRIVGDATASPPSAQIVEVQLNDEMVVDNWETHVIPTTPFTGKGNSDISSPPLSSNVNSFVTKRVKETIEEEAEDKIDDEENQDT